MNKYVLLLLLFYAEFACAMNFIVTFQQPNDQSLINIRRQLKFVPINEPERVCDIDPTMTMISIPLSDRVGVCYNYAMTKTLKKYGIRQKFAVIGCQDWQQVLTFFKCVKKVKKDDLAVYFNRNSNGIGIRMLHFGLVDDPETLRIESKFGTIMRAIFKHTLFFLPIDYGSEVGFMRLKKEYRNQGQGQTELLGFIKMTMEDEYMTKSTLWQHNREILKLVNQPADKKTEYRIMGIIEQMPSVSLNICDITKKTLLMIAVQNNNLSLVSLLLEYGANKNLKDMYGKTALDIAIRNGNDEMQQLLA